MALLPLMLLMLNLSNPVPELPKRSVRVVWALTSGRCWRMEIRNLGLTEIRRSSLLLSLLRLLSLRHLLMLLR